MANGHSAIDSLIANVTLQRYQEGGEVKPTVGQRFVQRFPSQHKDPIRAAEQERALTGLIDFIAPQSLGELGLMMAAGPVASKAGKSVKKSGEKMVTLYRGLGKWHPGKMVGKGMFIGKDKVLHTTPSKGLADYYRGRAIPFGSKGTGVMLEFEVPKKYIKKYGQYGPLYDRTRNPKKEILFNKGLPKEFLKKVYKK